jgi:hypothetical protein
MLFLVSRSPPECAENRRRPLNRVTLVEPVWFPLDVQMLPEYGRQRRAGGW